MRVLRDSSSCCFWAAGGGGNNGRSERVRSSIFSSKSPAMASIWENGAVQGTGFLIHWGLMLTTHANIPSMAAAELAEIRLDHGRTHARPVPHRFFITSSVLDLTFVGLDVMDDDTSQGLPTHYLKTCCNPSLDLGSTVYFLGHTDRKDINIGEGKVVIATDNLIKLTTDGVTWRPGSAGFDFQGNLAFMVCDPMKLASSPTAKSSSASSSTSMSSKKDTPTQFGIPIPIICDWLHQHWEGSLDEVSKPKLPLMRLMSTGQRSEHSCTSFTMRRVFKPTEGEDDNISSSSQLISRPQCHIGLGDTAEANTCGEETQPANLHSNHDQEISTPEIYESPKLTSQLVHKESTPVQLLDIKFPPKVPRSIVLPLPLRQMLDSKEYKPQDPNIERYFKKDHNAGVHSRLSCSEVNDRPVPDGCQAECCSEVQSCSSPLEVSELRNGDGFSSGEETMYSAETMESRNYPSPKENKLQQVGRSKSCVNYSRWSLTQRNSVSSNRTLKKHDNLVPVRNTHSQAAVTPQKSHDYFSPTVSSSMKKRNNLGQSVKPRNSAVHSSPRWIS